MQIPALGRAPVQLLDERQEFFRTRAIGDLADDFSRQDVEGSIQTGRAVAFVVMGAAADLPRTQRQPGLCPIQRLDLGLLIDAQHQGVSPTFATR